MLSVCAASIMTFACLRFRRALSVPRGISRIFVVSFCSALVSFNANKLRDWDPSNLDVIVVADSFFQERNRPQLETLNCYAKNWG